MAKPRTQTNVLALKGSFKEHPSRGRDRANEPVPVGEIGDPPADCDPAVRERWTELVTHAHAGTLCAADRTFMLYAAGVWAALRAQIMAGDPPCPKLGLRFESIIGRLGMSPADRSRVSVIKPSAEANKYAEFARDAKQ